MKYVEVRIEPHEDNFLVEGEGGAVYRIACSLEQFAKAVPIVEETGMRVTALVEYAAMSPEEFVEKHAKYFKILGALSKSPEFGVADD